MRVVADMGVTDEPKRKFYAVAPFAFSEELLEGGTFGLWSAESFARLPRPASPTSRRGRRCVRCKCARGFEQIRWDINSECSASRQSAQFEWAHLHADEAAHCLQAKVRQDSPDLPVLNKIQEMAWACAVVRAMSKLKT